MTKSKKLRRDPFLGFLDAAIECEWIDPPTSDAKIVRVIVDEDRWEPHWSNADYQRSTVAKIRRFVAKTLPTASLIVCPAGMVTIPLNADATPGQASQTSAKPTEGIDVLMTTLRDLQWGDGPAVLFGVDGAVPGECTPLQASMLIRHGANRPDPSSLVLKLYPAQHETASLVGWRRVTSDAIVLGELEPRQHLIRGTRVASLICHEAVAFSGRAMDRRSKTSARSLVAGHLARCLVGAQCVAVSMHWADRRKGAVFVNAARSIAELSNASVVVSTFAPLDQISSVAQRFVVADHRLRVATLAVTST